MIVVRFRKERDDELREWYQSLPKGDRSRLVRDILKEHVKPQIKLNNEAKNNKKIKQKNNIESKVDRLMDRF